MALVPDEPETLKRRKVRERRKTRQLLMEIASPADDKTLCSKCGQETATNSSDHDINDNNLPLPGESSA